MCINANEREYLLGAMEGLLDEYDYSWSSTALNKIIDEWCSQKAGLIQAFKKHPNYIEGKFMIAFDSNYERGIDTIASYKFRDWLRRDVMPYFKDTLPPEIQERTDYWSYLPTDIYTFFTYLYNYAERCVSESTANYLNEICPALHVHAGQKTSRVVNKLCCYLGYDKAPDYNKEFAKYADSLSPMTIKRHTVLSINPLDYLTMSFGNSWASCHTIDKENKRRMPNNYSGCYSSGTISYMLDSSSMVLYTVDASYDGNEYWNQPKINRQMFHYGEEKLVQGRLYPQDNDNCSDVYTPYRNIVQNIISTIFEFPNLWTISKGTNNASSYIRSDGTHYRDYEYYGNCSLSRIKGSENNNRFYVGASPICIECGDRHWTAENINCCNVARCSDCGARITNEEDIYYVNGEPYCRDCVYYCESCEEYHRMEEFYVRDFGYVCEDCFSRYYVECSICGDGVRDYDAIWIECEDRYVCSDCCDEHYFYCEECGEYYPNGEAYEHNGDCLCEDCYNNRIEEENGEAC